MREVDILVIGAGPAGLSAALEAAKHDIQVLVVDENEQAGGQLFKQLHKFFGSERHDAGVRGFDIGHKLLKAAEEQGVEILLNTVAYGIFPEGVGLCVNGKEGVIVKARKIIVATGASENPLAFPGWTLPGVVGAGAIQTMVNVHRVPVGRKILMIGSGNVGLIVSYQAMQAGIEVVGIVEAAPKVGGYAVHAAKVCREGVPVYVSHTVLKAIPNEDESGITGAVIVQVDGKFQPIPGTEKFIECDCIGIAVGLSPSIELVAIPGVEMTYLGNMGGYIPLHDRNLMTTMDGVYIAGDVSGTEEASTALEEGRLAGIAAVAALGRISEKEAEREKAAAWESLRQLRSGPFGEGRYNAKEEIIKRMEVRNNA